MNFNDLIRDYFMSLNIKNYLCDMNDINILIKKHLCELVFSNVELLLNKTVSLEHESVVKKLSLEKKGGYCFEHNKLLYEALVYSGYTVQAVSARVLNNRDEEVAKTHRTTILSYRRERYLIDVGFGFASPNVAVKFGSKPTITSLGTAYQIKDNRNGTYTLGILKGNDFFTLYSFELCHYNEADFEMSNFYSYANKNSKFINNLVISKVLEDKIVSLRNSSYYIIYKDETQKREISTMEEFKNVLLADFNYTLKDNDINYLYSSFIQKN